MFSVIVPSLFSCAQRSDDVCQLGCQTVVHAKGLFFHGLKSRNSPFTGTLQKIIQTVAVWLCQCRETETPALETHPKFSCDEKSHYCEVTSD